MDSSYVEDALTDAQQAFEREPAHKEFGLDTDDDALLQLRKACRLLDAARFLRTQNGYYINGVSELLILCPREEVAVEKRS